MAEDVTIVLNGSERVLSDLGSAPSIAVLVESLGLRADRVALECNGDIVPRATWGSTQLSTGDRLELVHFVGGGCQISLASN